MKMTAEQLKLYKSIDEILWFDWDPIGINKDGVRDEYYGYLPQVYQLKVNGSSKMEIAKHLDEIVTERMGMESNMEFSEQIAEKILALK
jgi:hypothetical protein